MAAAATRCGEEGGAAAMSGALARAHADSCAARVQQLACRVRPLLPLPAIENVLGEQAATQEKMAAPTDEASPTTKGIALEDWLPSPTSPRQELQPPALKGQGMTASAGTAAEVQLSRRAGRGGRGLGRGSRGVGRGGRGKVSRASPSPAHHASVPRQLAPMMCVARQALPQLPIHIWCYIYRLVDQIKIKAATRIQAAMRGLMQRHRRGDLQYMVQRMAKGEDDLELLGMFMEYEIVVSPGRRVPRLGQEWGRFHGGRLADRRLDCRPYVSAY